MKTVIIVAGGRGKRMGHSTPKQFMELDGLPVIVWTIMSFYNYDHKIKIILALPKNEIEKWETIKSGIKRVDIPPHILVEGGSERFFSVKNSLVHVGKGEIVAVHDGVRPFASKETISRCFKKAKQTGAAIPVITVTESIRYFENEDKSVSVNREHYKLVQTPQVFKSDILIAAYEQPYEKSFTDDASVVEKFGHPISSVEGNRENIKITRPIDMTMAKVFLYADIVPKL
jgi:2-C-methyl-D-erythritol 4-phosphate cytidylyltransferase